MVDQEVKYIEVRGESGPMEKTEALEAYFSSFSVVRRELIKEKISERSKGTRRIKVVLCPVNKKVEGGEDEVMKKLMVVMKNEQSLWSWLGWLQWASSVVQKAPL